MYRHWSSRQISQPPSDSGFGKETLSKDNQDSRKSYSPSAKSSIIFPKLCKNKAVSGSSLHSKRAFQMLSREECSRGSCCSMPECHGKHSAEHQQGKIHVCSQLLQSRGRSSGECWEHPGGDLAPTTGPRSASHVITRTHVAGSEYPNPSPSPISVFLSKTPPQPRKRRRRKKKYLFFPSKSADTITRLNGGQRLCSSFSQCSLTRDLSVPTTVRVKFLQLDFPPSSDPTAEPALLLPSQASLGFCPSSLASNRHLQALGTNSASHISVKRQFTSRSSDNSKKNARPTRSLDIWGTPYPKCWPHACYQVTFSRSRRKHLLHEAPQTKGSIQAHFFWGTRHPARAGRCGTGPPEALCPSRKAAEGQARCAGHWLQPTLSHCVYIWTLPILTNSPSLLPFLGHDPALPPCTL